MRFGFTRALLALAPRAAAERKVFAHYMVRRPPSMPHRTDYYTAWPNLRANPRAMEL